VVRRASGVLDDVLDLTAFETGTLRIDAEPTDLNQFLHAELEDSISDARMKNIRLDLVLPPEPVVAEVDEHRLGQVMSNLISNAIKYSWQGSTVTITLETTARDAVIRVRDEGIGIPRDELPNIFKAWCHGKSRTTGGETSHGIGLLVVKTIVEAHCGRIHVESREGSGTEFSFLLPLVRQQVVTEVSED
jgi:signal transduction histidine kinase